MSIKHAVRERERENIFRKSKSAGEKKNESRFRNHLIDIPNETIKKKKRENKTILITWYYQVISIKQRERERKYFPKHEIRGKKKNAVALLNSSPTFFFMFTHTHKTLYVLFLLPLLDDPLEGMTSGSVDVK
jgi:hypothetical protein